MPASTQVEVHGIDFSGAQDAGRRIWIASGVVDRGRLAITECRPACELPGGGLERDAALCALRSFIQRDGDAVFGLDFPFGLPTKVVAEPTWSQFVLAFGTRYPSADAFRAACQSLSQRELRRQTDSEAKAPWCAWNWRLYRQTYHGIDGVLVPLVRSNLVRVLPMEAPDDGFPWLLEICPASTLRRLGLARLPYKGTSRDHFAARKRILCHVVETTGIEVERQLMKRAIDDAGGDAIDSMLAAVAVSHIVSGDRLFPTRSDYQIEGHVYF
jgi:hypothetical protein